jgi:hypothetical protein
MEQDPIISQSQKQARLISTHNVVPTDRDLEQKHLDRAIKRASGALEQEETGIETKKDEPVLQPVKEEPRRGRPPIAKE